MSEPIGLINSDDPRFRKSLPRLGGARESDGEGERDRSSGGPQPAIREFQGFDVERAAYEGVKSKLLTLSEGKFFTFRGGETYLGPFETSEEAEMSGYEQFGFGPIYIKQVLAEEPVATVSRDV